MTIAGEPCLSLRFNEREEYAAMAMINILGFGGSRRKGSYNSALLRTAAQLMPDDARLEIYDISNIPMFEPELSANPPKPVMDFQDAIRKADGLLVATPEYNYSIPGYIKNVFDAASLPAERNPFPGKPVALLSASIGMLGGARAQYHLRQVFVFLDMIPVGRPEVFITFASQKFNENLELKDENSKDLIRKLLFNLVSLSKKLKRLD